jgi:tRNA pseudouridine55 synthase
MDGVLLVDKPSGPTSHDVVARLRVTTGERSIGHTGTLDPLATGLLPLVVGRATRLSALLTGSDKSYEATIRLGLATDTDDAQGRPLGPPGVDVPDAGTVRAALDRFRGTFDQVPPDHSAKKVGGRKAHDLARRGLHHRSHRSRHRRPRMRRHRGDRVHIRVTGTAGFYVRALARDLGRALGCGAHLSALRRTRSGRFDVREATPLADLERMGTAVADRLLSPAQALDDLPAVTVTVHGLKRAVHGNPLGPEHIAGRSVPPAGGPAARLVRILDPEGRLIALAHARGGALHPSIVLG